MKRLEEFVNFLRVEKRYSTHTVRAYADDVRQCFGYLYTCKKLEDLLAVRQNDIREWILELVNSGNLPRTIRRKAASLKAFYSFNMRQGNILINPADGITLPKVKKSLPNFINETAIGNLFEGNSFPDGFIGIRDQLILELFYATGIRLSELVNLKLSDIDLQKSELKVLGKRNKERLIPLTPNIVRIFYHFMDARKSTFPDDIVENLIVTDKGQALYPRMVQRLVRKYMSLTTTLEKKSPHVLRHTFATHMLNNGADLNAVKELLGHTNLAATEIYTHNTYKKLKAIYKQAHPRA